MTTGAQLHAVVASACQNAIRERVREIEMGLSKESECLVISRRNFEIALNESKKVSITVGTKSIICHRGCSYEKESE